MGEHFLRLREEQRAEILQSIAPAVGLAPIVLEKDIWVCWALQTLFAMPRRLPLAFKGGTSLSKIYGAIARFSEDVDLTIDYTALSEGKDPIGTPMSRTAIEKLTIALREAVARHVHEVVVPYLERVGQEQLQIKLEFEVDDAGEGVRIRYPTAFREDGRYVSESVLLEFGGRNTTLPNETQRVEPYIAPHLKDLELPIADVVALSPRRTFWEKVTLIHSECHRPERTPGAGPQRISRHWYDLAMLADHDIGQAAVAEPELLTSVVSVKKVFYRSGFSNYDACLNRGFRLVPPDPLRVLLAQDYEAMLRGSMFFETPPAFEQIMERIAALERALNQP